MVDNDHSGLSHRLYSCQAPLISDLILSISDTTFTNLSRFNLAAMDYIVFYIYDFRVARGIFWANAIIFYNFRRSSIDQGYNPINYQTWSMRKELLSCCWNSGFLNAREMILERVWTLFSFRQGFSSYFTSQNRTRLSLWTSNSPEKGHRSRMGNSKDNFLWSWSIFMQISRKSRLTPDCLGLKVYIYLMRKSMVLYYSF